MLDPTRQFWKISPPTLCLVNQDPRQDCKNPVYGIIPCLIKVWWAEKRWIDPTLPLAKKSSFDVKMKVIHIYTFLRLILQWQSRHLVYTSRFWLINTWSVFQHLERAAIQNFARTISNPTVTVIINISRTLWMKSSSLSYIKSINKQSEQSTIIVHNASTYMPMSKG